MLNIYLVVNKSNSIASQFLEEQKIAKIVHSASSLSSDTTIDQNIYDVDKFIYIYYGDVKDNNVAFKQDLSKFKMMLKSAFFSTNSILFILVQADPDIKEYVQTVLKESDLPKENIEIVEHNETLMIPELVKYISGVSLGDTTKNTYLNVYISEAGKNEKERYENKASDKIKNITPQLVDDSEMYRRRVRNVAISNDRIVSQKETINLSKEEFPMHKRKTLDFKETIVVSGEQYTNFLDIAKAYATYFEYVGTRCLVINMTNESFEIRKKGINRLSLFDLEHQYIPEHPISYINLNLANFSHLIANEDNLISISVKILVVKEELYSIVCNILRCSLGNFKIVKLIHKQSLSFEKLKSVPVTPDVIVVTNKLIDEDFDISSYRDDFHGTICVLEPDTFTTIDDQRDFYYDCFGNTGGEDYND